MDSKGLNGSTLTGKASAVGMSIKDSARSIISQEVSELVVQEERTGSELARLFYEFYTKTAESFRAYSKDPYSDEAGPWGEEVFLNAFGYFDDDKDSDGLCSKTRNDYLSCLKYDNVSGETYLRFNKRSSINIMLNNYRMMMLCQKLDEIPESSDRSTYLLRKLISARFLRLRQDLDAFSQFTYAGERYVVAKSALKRDLCADDGEHLNAIPFQHVQSLSQIDSARLIEKVRHQIVYKKLYKDEYCDASRKRIIRIAAFGSFTENGTLNIEALAQKGFFKEDEKDPESPTYDVKVVSFRVKSINPVSIDFVEDNPDIPEDKRLSGSLYDVGFLKKVTDKYDITCLLDMGCFYRDTTRGIGCRSGSPYEDVIECIRVIDVQKERDGVEGIDVISYINLYKAYLKWIEFTFYGENHQYEFDPRLFAALVRLKKEARKGRSIFTYLSRNRGEALKKKYEYSDFCRTEFYKGVGLSVYDWRKTESCESDQQKEYFAKVYRSDYTDKLSFRFWKMLKSIDDYFYTETFSRLLEKGSSSADCEFVEFCYKTTVVFDYSHLRSDRIISYSIVSAYEDVAGSDYLNIAKTFVDAILKIVFDPNCYDPCSTPFCRRILANVILADAVTVEQLMLAHMISTSKLQCAFASQGTDMDKERYDRIRHLFDQEYGDPLLTARRHCINGVFADAISKVNSKPYSLFCDARDELYRAIKEYAGEIEPSEILRKLGDACKRIGFSNCTIAICSK